MVFGRGEPEKVHISELDSLLDASLNRKIAGLEAKAEGIGREMRRAMKEFIDACDEFETLGAEPYTEDIYMPNTAFIKSRKSLYAKALKVVVGNAKLEEEEIGNIYARYSRMLRNAQGINNDILRTNAHFKMVVHCYSNHLRGFKRSMSQMERLVQSLGRELDGRKEEYEQYERLDGQIDRMKLEKRELGSLGADIRELRSAAGRGASALGGSGTEREAEGRLLRMKDGIAVIDSDISKLHAAINSAIAPLERAARKYDHLSLGRKRQLHAYVADPAGSIGGEHEYVEFISMVREMKGNLDAGKIDVKNREEISSVAESLLDSDTYSAIVRLRSARAGRAEAEKELRFLETTLLDLRKGRASAEEIAHDVEAMEGKEKELQGSLESSKGAAERLFLDYYGKRISITL